MPPWRSEPIGDGRAALFYRRDAFPAATATVTMRLGSVMMKKPRKVTITCAVTGAIHTPSMSPYLPITVEEIADAAVEAAAVVHLHARDPKTGKPDQSPEAFAPLL